MNIIDEYNKIIDSQYCGGYKIENYYKYVKENVEFKVYAYLCESEYYFEVIKQKRFIFLDTTKFVEYAVCPICRKENYSSYDDDNEKFEYNECEHMYIETTHSYVFKLNNK